MVLVTKFLLPLSTLSGTKEGRFQGTELGRVQMAASCGDHQVFLLLRYPVKPKLSYRSTILHWCCCREKWTKSHLHHHLHVLQGTLLRGAPVRCEALLWHAVLCLLQRCLGAASVRKAHITHLCSELQHRTPHISASLTSHDSQKLC